MEGGGIKGIYTAGIIDVFLENNIQADIALGCSAGVAFGCNYKSRQKGRVIRYVSKYRKNWRFGSLKSWFKTGDYFNAKFCYEEIPDKLDPWDKKTFSENPCDFYSVVTDLETGKPFFHKFSDGGKQDIQYIRASSSVPVLSNIVELEGHKYLDGGLSCSIPLAKAMELGCNKNIVICTKLKEDKKNGMDTIPFIKWRYRKYPAFLETVNNCQKNYEEERSFVEKQEKEGTAFVFYPSRRISCTVVENDIRKIRALYNLGREDALARLGDLKKFLQN